MSALCPHCGGELDDAAVMSLAASIRGKRPKKKRILTEEERVRRARVMRETALLYHQGERRKKNKAKREGKVN